MAKKIITDPQYKIAKLYEEVFSSAAGERVLADLRRLFYDQSPHIPGDVYGTLIQVGCQEVVRHIKNMLNLAEHPEIFTSAENVEEF